MKEITFQLITQLDGTIKPKVKSSDEEFTQDDLYMIYKYIEVILSQTDFDWSKEGFIEGIVQKGIKE